MAKVYVMAQLVPNKARDGYELREIGIYSEPHPTSTVGDIFCLIFEATGPTLSEAYEEAVRWAPRFGGRLLGDVVGEAARGIAGALRRAR